MEIIWTPTLKTKIAVGGLLKESTTYLEIRFFTILMLVMSGLDMYETQHNQPVPYRQVVCGIDEILTRS